MILKDSVTEEKSYVIMQLQSRGGGCVILASCIELQRQKYACQLWLLRSVGLILVSNRELYITRLVGG